LQERDVSSWYAKRIIGMIICLSSSVCVCVVCA
jgi:hypothetical protein